MFFLFSYETVAGKYIYWRRKFSNVSALFKLLVWSGILKTQFHARAPGGPCLDDSFPLFYFGFDHNVIQCLFLILFVDTPSSLYSAHEE